MYLESLCHDESAFVTLTYGDDKLPSGGSLVPADPQRWLKRLRKAVEPHRVRYFLVGEYGDETERPHYHAALFGVGRAHARIIDQTWSLGFTYTAEFNERTAQYVAGYVVKKMTSKDDVRLDGRYPEFARMSRRPGIGAAAMAVIADQLHTDAGLDELLKIGDVPYQLKMGRMSIPLGRYLREVLRDEMAVPQEWRERVKARFTVEKSNELLAMYQTAKGSAISIKAAFVQSQMGAIQSLEARSRIRRKKGKL